MGIIEIIEIRLVENLNQKLETEIEQVINDLMKDESGNTMKLYKKLKLNSDYIIIISHNKGKRNRESSEIGQRLKAALNDFGLINHSLWDKIKTEKY